MRMEGLLKPSHIQKAVSAVGRSRYAAQFFGTQEHFGCFSQSPLVMEQNPMKIDDLSIQWRTCLRPAQPLPGAGQIISGHAKLAASHQDMSILRFQRKCLAKNMLGFRLAPLFAQQQSQVKPPIHIFRAEGDGPRQRRFGMVKPALFAQEYTKIHPCCGKIGTARDGTPIMCYGVVHVPQARENEAHAKIALGHVRGQFMSLPIVGKRLCMPIHGSQ